MTNHNEDKPATQGRINRVAGPVVTAIGISAKMNDIVHVGHEELMGEVIKILGGKTIIQVYEDTSGVRPGEPVVSTGHPLEVELGPGLLTSIYDGIQRPLPVLREKEGDFIFRGITADALDIKKVWQFTAKAKVGDEVSGGMLLGLVQETPVTQHRILLPPTMSGKIKELNSGEFTVRAEIGRLEDGTPLSLSHRWPVRVPRPIKDKLMPQEPLITGQRVIDIMFPIPKGGTGAIPGGFGTGKTVTQQQLAKWSDAEVVVYVGCGERGNEMTEVLTEFPALEDPQTGQPLMNRTILLANTSNMPVAAREASVYVGMTLAEYYRDQGYNIALMADSTSRWAEAMREISSRLEEMPGEEGYPAYLSARLSEFYERAGRVNTLGQGEGSVTVIGAVSPPGGDFSEPVTQNTLRIVKVFWALDTKLRERRHFPAIDWLRSYSLYGDMLAEWYQENVDADFDDTRSWAMQVLQREDELQEIVQLVGSDSLPKEQRLILEVARMIREFFLQQNAFHKVDTFSPIKRQFRYLELIRDFSIRAERALALGRSLEDVTEVTVRGRLGKAKFEADTDSVLEDIADDIRDTFAAMGVDI